MKSLLHSPPRREGHISLIPPGDFLVYLEITECWCGIYVFKKKKNRICTHLTTKDMNLIIYYNILLEIVMGSILAITILHDYIPRTEMASSFEGQPLKTMKAVSNQSKQGSFGLQVYIYIFT